MYMEASYKPYIIAAMIMLAKAQHPADTLATMLHEGRARIR
jgi:hypothetical protein